MTSADSENTAWRARAACKGQPLELFFGDGAGDPDATVLLHAEGRRVCDGCPVREDCLEWALAGGKDVVGMWGGTTDEERERLLRHIARAKCPVCSGPDLHAGDWSQVCRDCGHSWSIARPSSQARLNADAAV